jgi:GT2 family glycosyltransferase
MSATTAGAPTMMNAPNIVAAFGAATMREADAMRQATLVLGCTVAVCTYRRPAALSRLLDSVLAQDRLPDEVLIIDASPDDATEHVVLEHPLRERLRDRLSYIRVTGALRGLTRQRNVALSVAATDLIAFFDDDIVLDPQCIAELERAHRDDATRAGVGAHIQGEWTPIPLLWRMRRALRIVPTLEPGVYCRSGFSIPWAFLPPGDDLVRGDFLPGGAVMWRTALARTLAFNERFTGYGSAEDLEFSLRIAAHGALVMHRGARLHHLHDDSGRPDDYQLGYTSTQNAYHIHRTCLRGRTWRDAAWFWYAFVMDSALRSLNLVRPPVARHARRFLRGRFRFMLDLWTGRLAAPAGARREQ